MANLCGARTKNWSLHALGISGNCRSDFASLQFFQGAMTMPAPGIVERVFFKLHVRHC